MTKFGNPQVRFHKLTESQVMEIREELRSGIPQPSIAAKYGLHLSAVSNIKRGITWGWLRDVEER